MQNVNRFTENETIVVVILSRLFYSETMRGPGNSRKVAWNELDLKFRAELQVSFE